MTINTKELRLHIATSNFKPPYLLLASQMLGSGLNVRLFLALGKTSLADP
jgi:hypothetical protein